MNLPDWKSDICSAKRDRIIYYGRDAQKSNWTYSEIKNAAGNIYKIQKRLNDIGKRLLVVVVPDKSSVYKECIPHSVEALDVTKILIQSGVNTPDLISEFKRARNQITDLYLPDDTHLSTIGFILMGNLLVPYLISSTCNLG